MTSILGSGWPEKATWLFSACVCPSDTKLLIFSSSKHYKSRLSVGENWASQKNTGHILTCFSLEWCCAVIGVRFTARLGTAWENLLSWLCYCLRTFTVGPHDVRERIIVNSREGEREITVWDQEVISRKVLKTSAWQSKGDRWRLTGLKRGRCTHVILCVSTHVHRWMCLHVASVMCEWVGRGGGGGEEIKGRVHAQSLSCVQLFATPRL